MPPKKDAVAAPKKEGATGKDGATANANANDQLIPGFTAREQKFLAAALLSCTAPGKVSSQSRIQDLQSQNESKSSGRHRSFCSHTSSLHWRNVN
jgi:hypothetical protein